MKEIVVSSSELREFYDSKFKTYLRAQELLDNYHSQECPRCRGMAFHYIHESGTMLCHNNGCFFQSDVEKGCQVELKGAESVIDDLPDGTRSLVRSRANGFGPNFRGHPNGLLPFKIHDRQFVIMQSQDSSLSQDVNEIFGRDQLDINSCYYLTVDICETIYYRIEDVSLYMDNEGVLWRMEGEWNRIEQVGNISDTIVDFVVPEDMQYYQRIYKDILQPFPQFKVKYKF
jgi:hypothetical protein